MNIGKFRQYREKNFGVKEWSEMIQDKRKRPQIPTLQIFECLSEAPVFGQKNLLEMDAFWRLPEARRYYGSDRDIVASDTTLERVTEGMSLKSVQAVGYAMPDKADEQHVFDLTLPSGRRLRLGIVDGL